MLLGHGLHEKSSTQEDDLCLLLAQLGIIMYKDLSITSHGFLYKPPLLCTSMIERSPMITRHREALPFPNGTATLTGRMNEMPNDTHTQAIFSQQWVIMTYVPFYACTRLHEEWGT